MTNPALSEAERSSMRTLIERAHAEMGLEQRCLHLAKLNQEYMQRIAVYGTRNRRLRACLMGAWAIAACATLAAIAIWGAR